MQQFFEMAVKNIVAHGDTDIFPFPIENFLFFDRRENVVAKLLELHNEFDKFKATYPPVHESALAPVSYTGFRWATQLDPFWNAYFLGLVLSLADKIEAARVPVQQNVVFSYRYSYDGNTSDLFRKDFGWLQFMQQSFRQAKKYKYVVSCDISEFYPRLAHHRLENALGHLSDRGNAPSRIMQFLSDFKENAQSFGLPIGGPAARILSELVLDQIDRLLLGASITFCRFADDYHLFADSQEDAYAALIFLSEKLYKNQGLSLQKSKTRIMTGPEFIGSSPVDDPDLPPLDKTETPEQSAKLFLRFSVKFDPYSETAAEDYEALKEQLKQFDIIGMLKSELSKSRVHIALAKKIAASIKFLEPQQKNQAALSLMENLELLYPIFPTVMVVISSVFDELDAATQEACQKTIRVLCATDSHIVRIDLNVAYAIRVLSKRHSPENEEILQALYRQRTAAFLRRDIILVLAKWNVWGWISDLRNSFRTLTDAERRAFIIASYLLKDEGRHWRDYTKDQFSPFEKEVRDWAVTCSPETPPIFG